MRAAGVGSALAFLVGCSYPSAQVRKQAANDFGCPKDEIVNIKVDATNEVDPVEELRDRFDVQSLPTIAFISSHGELLSDPRVDGFLTADKFLAEMHKVR